MKTFSERLAWAMECRGLSPHTDQSTLARMVGAPCKPQNIQHLLDPNKNAKSSRYTPLIAAALNIDVLWLAEGIGRKPARGDSFASEHETNEPTGQHHQQGISSYENSEGVNTDAASLNRTTKVPMTDIERFIDALRSAAQADRVTPSRLRLLQGLLHDWNTQPTGGIEHQRLPTRGGHGRQTSKRGRTGTN